jgi:hypothetical protein
MINIEYIQGGSNMTGTNCDLFTHKSSRSYLNHLLIFIVVLPSELPLNMNMNIKIGLFRRYVEMRTKN